MDEKERTPLYRVEGGVAWLTLNRPETLNSFTTEFVHEINDAVRAAEEDDKVRTLVVTGEGRGFTSGGNLSELAAMNRDRKRAIYDVDSTADMVHMKQNNRSIVARDVDRISVMLIHNAEQYRAVAPCKFRERQFFLE